MFALILTASCVIEIIVTVYTRSVSLGLVLPAVLSSGAIRLFSSYIVLRITKTPKYIIAAVIGDMIGTLLAMTLWN